MSIALGILSWILLLAGGAFCMIGALGLVRMPDFFTRMHAASVTDTLGAGLLLLGLMLQAGLSLVTVKLIVIGLLIFFTSPTSTHALAQAALAAVRELDDLQTTRAAHQQRQREQDPRLLRIQLVRRHEAELVVVELDVAPDRSGGHAAAPHHHDALLRRLLGRGDAEASGESRVVRVVGTNSVGLRTVGREGRTPARSLGRPAPR